MTYVRFGVCLMRERVRNGKRERKMSKTRKGTKNDKHNTQRHCVTRANPHGLERLFKMEVAKGHHQHHEMHAYHTLQLLPKAGVSS